MQKIRLISCYFGQLPKYFSIFIETCLHNPTVDFLFFHNCFLPNNFKIIAESNSNIEFHYLNLEEFNVIATEKIGLKIDIKYAYKLCDLKPAYGKIFEDYLVGYDFWGHIDVDIIFGDIRAFISEDMLSKNDIISPHKKYIAGWFTLFRNNDYINNIFKSSKDYKKVFASNRHFCFDECNFSFWDLLIQDKNILEVTSEVESMTHVVNRLTNTKKITSFFGTMAEESINDRLVWNNGKLFKFLSQKEILLFHMIQIKDSPFFNFPSWNSLSGVFYITNTGFYLEEKAFDMKFKIISKVRRLNYIYIIRDQFYFSLGHFIGNLLHGIKLYNSVKFPRENIGIYKFNSFSIEIKEKLGKFYLESDFFPVPFQIIPINEKKKRYQGVEVACTLQFENTGNNIGLTLFLFHDKLDGYKVIN